LILSGRRSEHINVSGLKFAPEIVEGAILNFEGVRDCAAFGVPDSIGGEQVWAAFVADHDVDLAALSAHCASKLGIRAPGRLLQVANLPRNEAGKILRSELQRLASGSAGQPPGT
ncbi:MAG TPA: hypothetical protein VHA37_06590, partial [Candidatus Saccharimonadales bacterium]|nr:hypothetical protein [Candidatus Saccharimonadales bacterium]